MNELEKGQEAVQHVVELVPIGRMLLADEGSAQGAGCGKTLELIMWKKEPAIVIDGKWIIRRSALLESVMRHTSYAKPMVEEKDNG